MYANYNAWNNPSDQTMNILEDSSNRPLFSQPASFNPILNQPKKGFLRGLLSRLKFVLFGEDEAPYPSMHSTQPTYQGSVAPTGTQPNNSPLYPNTNQNQNQYQNQNPYYPSTTDAFRRPAPPSYTGGKRYGIQGENTYLYSIPIDYFGLISRPTK